MLRYTLKRLLIFIPTLLAVSVVTFLLSSLAPGDPVENMLQKSSGALSGNAVGSLAQDEAYQKISRDLGYDLPVFYFSVTSAAIPDTLYRIPRRSHRDALEKLSEDCGNWNCSALFYESTQRFTKALNVSSMTNTDRKIGLNGLAEELRNTTTSERVYEILEKMERQVLVPPFDPSLLRSFFYLKAAAIQLSAWPDRFYNYIPTLHVYGTENRYHRWLSGFISGDMGISYQDQRPVSSLLAEAIPYTLILSLVSVVLSYLIAVPVGVFSARNKGSKPERIVSTGLFMLYSLPNFWIATLLIVFLCGGDYLDLFPAFGVGDPDPDAGWWQRFTDTAYHLFLPVVCYTYGSLAYISRQMRGGMLNVLGQDYIRTARAKGLEENTVIWKHALRNSLLPIITLFAGIFPLVVSGSFVIEFIFSIPGMGKLSMDALMARNYPVVFSVLMITAFMTMLGSLVADILYALSDPRISYSSKNE